MLSLKRTKPATTSRRLPSSIEVHTQAKFLDELMERIEEAIALCLEVA